MNWPDFFGRRAKAEAELWRTRFENEKHTLFAVQKANYETNLRLISALREMDQGTFQISQVAPDWARVRPIFQKMFEATEKRMATENNRIKNLMVGEIVTAYNEPKSIGGTNTKQIGQNK